MSLQRALAEALRPARQIRFAAERALTDVAFAARKAVQVAMPAVFDRPTPFVVQGVKVRTPKSLRENAASNIAEFGSPGRFGRDELVAVVAIDDVGRGKGSTPEKTLRAEVYGGTRGFKGAERRLQQAGLMLPGQFMVPSAELLKQTGNLVDQYGNVRGPFIRSLLSYLQAFNTAGFTANSSKKTIARIAARGKSERGFVVINGVEYFISRGKGERNGRQQHLAAGIWARRGIHGAQVYPVFHFVNSVHYRQRLRFEEIVSLAVDREFPRKFAERVAKAFATVR